MQKKLINEKESEKDSEKEKMKALPLFNKGRAGTSFRVSSPRQSLSVSMYIDKYSQNQCML